MDVETIIVCGVIVGAIALWLGSRWQRRQSRSIRAAKERLLHSNRMAVYVASGCFFAGLVLGIALYPLAGFAQDDWRPMGLGFGGGCLAALLALTIVPVLTRQPIRDAFAAFAVSESSPSLVVYAILGAGVLAFCWALASLIA